MLTLAALNNIHPMPGVSKNYEFMPTTRIIDIMEKDGFEVTKCLQGNSRKPNGGMYAKHRVHFRKKGISPNEVTPEIVVINSHDRGAALRFLSGFIRWVCENGLVAGDIMSDTNKIYHTNRNPFDLVLERAAYASQVLDSKLDIIKQMQETPMKSDAIYDFCERATQLPVFKDRTFVEPVSLANLKRWQDANDSVWHIFNRVQENIKKGDAMILGVSGKIRKARPIKSIDMDIKYNQQLWSLAEEYITA